MNLGVLSEFKDNIVKFYRIPVVTLELIHFNRCLLVLDKKILLREGKGVHALLQEGGLLTDEKENTPAR